MLAFLLISSVLITSTVGNPNCAGPADASYLYEDDPDWKFCITVETDTYSRQKGFQKCTSYDNGKLLKISSAELAAFVIDKVNLHSKSFPVWLIARYDNGEWKYDGATTGSGSYTNWKTSGEPDGTNRCAVMVNNEEWETSSCDQTHTVVCQYNKRIIPCPGRGWVMNPTIDACIKPIKRRRLNFEKANAYCQKLGGNLATKMALQSQRSQVRKLVKSRGNYWIGIRDINGDGTFTDFEGNNLASTAFKKSGPFSNVRQCATWKKGWWYPKKCWKRLFFICEKDVAV